MIGYRVVAVFDNNAHTPRTHLVRPEAAAQGGPFYTLCNRRVVGRLLDNPDVAQVPCPRCFRAIAPRVRCECGRVHCPRCARAASA